MPTARPTPSPDAAIDEHRQLVEAAAAFTNGFQRWLGSHGSDGRTYPELRLMEQLHCRGPAKMRTLADGLGLSARNMTALADTLEHDGLLRRVGHPTDRRATLLELTDSGMAAAEESLEPRLAEMGRLFDRLPASKRQALLSSLRALTEAMDAPDETAP